MTKIIDNTNLGYLISKIKSAFWPKTDVVPIGLDETPTSNSSNLVMSGGVYSALENKYEKPSTGIPATDLASAVQTSLGKADTALQSYTETDPVYSASAAAGITSSDITSWNNKVSNVQSDWNATSGLAQILNKPTIPAVPSEMTASEATTGTSTTARTISASVLTSTIDAKITTMTQTEVDTIVNTIFS